MASTFKSSGSGPIAATTLAAALFLSSAAAMNGCATVGPASIANGRMVYNEVITQTNSEQLLAMIVRLRYGEPFGMLNVASVTASLKIGASLGGQFGVGPSKNYVGNLVPISAGLAYEENPTISYIPMSGEYVMTRMLSSLPLDVLIPLLAASDDLEGAINLLVSRMNVLRRSITPGADTPADFSRAARLMGELRRENMLDFGLADPKSDDILLIIHNYDPHAQAQVVELLSLLKISDTKVHNEGIMIPVRSGILRDSKDMLLLETPPLLKLIQQMGFDIQLPQEHIEAGIAMHSNAPPPVPGGLLIRSSRTRPASATVMTQFRGYWFYIDDADSMSKLRFIQMLVIVGMRLSDPGAGTTLPPVLTIPVGG